MTAPATPTMHDFAERIFVAEAAAATPSQTGRPVVARICEKLQRSLTTLAGAAGFRSLLVRALTLAQRKVPGLSGFRVNKDGSLETTGESPGADPGAAGLQPDAREAGEVVLIAHLIELLSTFIGGTLTLRLMHDVWPDTAFSVEEPIGKANPSGRESSKEGTGVA